MEEVGVAADQSPEVCSGSGGRLSVVSVYGPSWRPYIDVRVEDRQTVSVSADDSFTAGVRRRFRVTGTCTNRWEITDALNSPIRINS